MPSHKLIIVEKFPFKTYVKGIKTKFETIGRYYPEPGLHFSNVRRYYCLNLWFFGFLYKFLLRRDNKFFGK